MIDQEKILQIQERISAAARRSGRSSADVKLMAVSKTRTRDEVLIAKSLGLTLFGENRVQEAREKFEGIEGVRVELIGHLQKNKVNKSVGFFQGIQSVDSLELAQKISNRAQSLGVVQELLIEQNCSGESSKSGFSSRDELLKNVETIRRLPGLSIKGLMTIAPFTSDEAAVRNSFISLRTTFERLRGEEGLTGLEELSMGMSGDFEVAIEEGSTLVRVGTALFGERNYV